MGIFGIFGETGSGKSTIIDAITMALYGKMPRYETVSNRQFINTNLDTAKIYFKFQLSDAVYVIEREYKGKNTLKVNARFYELCEPIRIIADKNKDVNEEAEKIIGLSYEDFSRSVVLPQGKFSEFLLLVNKDRRNMLERIFNLEKYGERLNKRIHEEYYSKEKELLTIETKLQAYDGLNAEIIADKEEILNIAIKQSSFLEQQVHNLNQQYLILMGLNKTVEEYDSYLKQEQECEQFSNQALDLENKIQRANQSNKIMPHVNNLRDAEEKISLCIKGLEESDFALQKTDEKIADISARLNKATYKTEFERPLLVKTEYDLLEAKKKQAEYAKLEIERTELLVQYTELSTKQKNNEEQLAELEGNRKELADKLLTLSERKSQITVDPIFRQKIQTAVQIRDKSVELSKTVRLLQQDISELDLLIKNEKNLQEDKERLIKNHQELLDELSENSSELMQNKPTYEEAILSGKMKIAELESKFQLSESKMELFKQLKAKEKELVTLLKKQQETKEELQQIINKQKESLFELEKQYDEILLQNSSFILVKQLKTGEPCPICGSAEHPNPVTQGDLQTFSRLAERDELKERVNENQSKLNNLNSEIAANQRELWGLEQQIEQTETELLDYKTEALKDEISELKLQLENTINKLNENDSALKTLEKRIEKGNKQLTKLQIEKNGCIERIAKDTDQFLAKQNEYAEKSQILPEYNSKLAQIQQEININDVEKENEKIKLFDLELQEVDKLEKEARQQQEADGLKFDEIQKKIISGESKIQEINTVGKEKRNQMNKLQESITAVIGERDLEEYLKEVRNEITEIDSSHKNLSNEYEKLNVEKNELQQNIIQLKTKLETQGGLKTTYQQQLNKEFEQSNLKTIEEAEQSQLSLDEISSLEKKLKEYYENKLKIRQNLERVKEILDKSHLPLNEISERYEIVVEELSQSKLNYENKSKEVAIISSVIEKAKKELETVNQLSQQRQKVMHKVNCLKILSDLLKGNKFVEFIAQRQLQYIAYEASHRLKEMSNGRYALSLVGSDFTIRDDFNGGELRLPRTLSGGEIFITSLCLALALSSKIKLKNNAQLEFFFLDEGFGSLDQNLLETVISSLEHLRNDNLTVGVISHIDELKNRMPIKLLVSPPVFGLHGTKVSLS